MTRESEERRRLEDLAFLADLKKCRTVDDVAEILWLEGMEPTHWRIVAIRRAMNRVGSR